MRAKLESFHRTKPDGRQAKDKKKKQETAAQRADWAPTGPVSIQPPSKASITAHTPLPSPFLLLPIR